MIAQGGDGGTTDIGMGCLSGMFDRNDDVLYVCYNNEAYMNTGVQRSSQTPPAARTATTTVAGNEPGNELEYRQERAADRDGARHTLCRDRIGARSARPRAQGGQGDGLSRRALPGSVRALSAGLGFAPGRHHQGGAPGHAVRNVSTVRGRVRRADGFHQDP